MGRNTLLSLPKWPLPNRRHTVITDKTRRCFPGCETVFSIDEAIEKVKTKPKLLLLAVERCRIPAARCRALHRTDRPGTRDDAQHAVIRRARDGTVVVEGFVQHLPSRASASALSVSTGSPLTLPEVATSGDPKLSSSK